MFTKKAQGSLRNFCRLLTADCRLLLRPRNHSKNNTAPLERKKSDPQLLLRKYRSAGAEKIRPAIIATKIPLCWSGKNQTPNYCYENTAPLERVNQTRNYCYENTALLERKKPKPPIILVVE